MHRLTCLLLQVSPRFKAGFSVFDANGQWLSAKNVVDHEHSKELMVVYTPSVFIEYSIETVRKQYKQMFSQESVMRVDSVACVSF